MSKRSVYNKRNFKPLQKRRQERRIIYAFALRFLIKRLSGECLNDFRILKLLSEFKNTNEVLNFIERCENVKRNLGEM